MRHSVGLLLGALAFAGCAAVAGVSDYAVDPCFDGCGDGATTDAPAAPDTNVPPAPDGALPDVVDAALDVPIDAPPPPSPGQSFVTLSGTGVAVGKSGVVTLIAKDDGGDLDTRVGAKVTFTTSGGTSVVSFGAVTDNGDGTYRATITGVTEGTKILVSAVMDGAPLTTPGASFRVANPIATSLTFSLDAANADTANHYGGNNCPGSAFTTWKDLGAGALSGILRGFDAIPCSATSGWNGTGVPADPFRLTFDGVDDHVGFGSNNSLTQQTILAWVRQTGPGKPGTTGPGGFEPATVPPLPRIVPIISKGTAQAEADDRDINFYLGITTTNQLGSDYESSTWVADPSGNAPLMGGTVLLDNTWYMVGMTLDTVAGTRKLFVNGAQDASIAATNVPSTGSNSLMVVGGAKRTTDSETCPAGITGCARFQGDIAAVLTYDRALTQAEIEKSCHSFSSRFGIVSCPN